MSKGGGVPSVQVPWQMTQAIGKENDIAQQQIDLGNQIYQYGKQRTAKYADPVLNEFLRIMGVGSPTGVPGPTTATGGAAGLDTTKSAAFTGPLSSSLYQLPVWQTGQALNATEKQIKNTVPAGPQQAGLITQAQNQRSQNLGAGAYSNVNSMLQSLLGQGNAVWQGAQAAQTGLAGAASTTGAAGSLAGNIASIQEQNQALQIQAQQSGNSLLGGIFGSIGSLAGFGVGSFAGSKAGSEAIAGLF